MAKLLKTALPQLSKEAYPRRLEFAVRQCSTSIYHQARQPNAFRGDQAELFVHCLQRRPAEPCCHYKRALRSFVLWQAGSGQRE